MYHPTLYCFDSILVRRFDQTDLASSHRSLWRVHTANWNPKHRREGVQDHQQNVELQHQHHASSAHAGRLDW